MESKRQVGIIQEIDRLILLDAIPAIILQLDQRGKILYFNTFMETLGGYTLEEARGKNWFEFFLPERERKRARDAFAEAIGGNSVRGNINAIVTKSGEERLIRWYDQILNTGKKGQCSLLATGMDVTELEQGRVLSQRSGHRFRALIDALPQGIFMKAPDLTYVACNMAHARILGLESPKDIIGRRDDEFLPPKLAHKYQADDKRVLELGDSTDTERMIIIDGREATVHTVKTAVRDEQGHITGVLGIYWNISERKKAEMALEHANRALMTLGTVNRELVHATDEADLLQAICTAIVEQHGYRMAWVGYARDNAAKDVELMASAGVPEDMLENIRPGWGNDPRSIGPTGRAIRTGETQIARDIASEPVHDWKDAMLKAGCASDIALPLKGETGAAFGLLHVYADEVDAFADNEIRLLEEMAGDLAFGVNALRVRLERDDALRLNEQHLAEMRQNLDETIVAITKAVEARDPYTAGHQRQVAKLAVAIARRMGLDEDTLQGIHMGAMIHDIGKINIPAEILSKPSRLNETELQMVKIHSKIGYDILKDIHFPWPVAEVAYQHHERIDGSGYPQGLKGEQICLEARIVAVADVVEAMTSHRPYRPGLGREAAIAEIRDHRGKFYDIDAVDACLAVLAEGFDFS